MTVYRRLGGHVTERSGLILQGIEVLSDGQPGLRHWFDVAAAGGVLPDLGGLRASCGEPGAGMVGDPAEATRLTCLECQLRYMHLVLVTSP